MCLTVSIVVKGLVKMIQVATWFSEWPGTKVGCLG